MINPVKFRNESCERLRNVIDNKIDKVVKKLSKLKRKQKIINNIIISSSSISSISTGGIIPLLVTNITIIPAICLITVAGLSSVISTALTTKNKGILKQYNKYKDKLEDLHYYKIEFNTIYSKILDNNTISKDEFEEIINLEIKVNKL